MCPFRPEHGSLWRYRSKRGDGVSWYDAERPVQRALWELVHWQEERSDHCWILRRGNPGKGRATKQNKGNCIFAVVDLCFVPPAHHVRTGGDYDHVGAEAAAENVSRLHLLLSPHWLPADQRVHQGSQTTSCGRTQFNSLLFIFTVAVDTSKIL